MNRRDIFKSIIGLAVASKVVAKPQILGKADNRNPWSTGLYPIKRHLIVFDDQKKAQTAFKRSVPNGSWDVPVLVNNTQMIWKSKGREYRYAVVRNIDEAYYHAGVEYQSIVYECDVDLYLKEYLNSRIRQVS